MDDVSSERNAGAGGEPADFADDLAQLDVVEAELAAAAAELEALEAGTGTSVDTAS